MPQILLPQRFLSQPQYPARLDKNHWFGSRATFAITGAAPDFNAATGRREAITGGGSGFSIRTTIHGKSLYTPDGGWVNFDVGQDWAGPNTIIALCRVSAIDSPWGGLFSKEATSTSTQFAIGRNDSSDSLYGSVANATALSFGAGTILSLEDFCVIAFTHSGAAGTTMSYYRNGVLTGATTALDAQPSGADVLGLGRSRDALATYDSDVDWIAFLRAPFVASAEQIRELSSNIWSIWKAPKRRIWTVSSGATSSLSGQALAISQGSLGVDTSVALSGQQGSLSSGTLSTAGDAIVALSGQSLSSAQGLLFPETDVSIVGQSLSSSQGGLGVSLDAGLPGQALALSQGAIGTQGDVTVALSGMGMTASQGLLSPPQAPSEGGHFAGVHVVGRKRKKRDLVDRDRNEIRHHLKLQLDEAYAALFQPEIPAEIQEQAATVIKQLKQPGRNDNIPALQQEVFHIRQMLNLWEQQARQQAEYQKLQRQTEEDEELLMMFL